MADEKNVPRLEVYLDRSILVERDGDPDIFLEGAPTEEAKVRLTTIKDALSKGYLEKIIDKCQSPDVGIKKLENPHQDIIEKLVSSVTSEFGRAIIGLTILQLCIKSISPTQNIRLHKSGARGTNFSWQEGISMRALDKNFITPVLRKTGLLKLNADGFMMTRSLAENYPYSSVYKAAIRGNRPEWLKIVEAVEVGKLDAENALKNLILCLINRSEKFRKEADSCIRNVKKASCNLKSIADAQSFLIDFVNSASYSARLFEVAMHSLFQVLDEDDVLEGTLKPLSQMRSANKKHGNIGDIEILDFKGEMEILESWDSKFGKLDLRDELEELDEKLGNHLETNRAGFVTNCEPTLRSDLVERICEIETIHDVKIEIISFETWSTSLADRYAKSSSETAKAWAVYFAESLCQRRREQAPIDEPCDAWVVALNGYAEAHYAKLCALDQDT